MLRERAGQLVHVLADIFKIFLITADGSTCFNATIIIPVPNWSSVACGNHCPFAHAPLIMKCFERLVMRHIKTLVPPSLDPLQVIHLPNHCVDDAITTTLDLAITHRDCKDVYVPMLFIDFSVQHNHSSALEHPRAVCSVSCCFYSADSRLCSIAQLKSHHFKSM